MGITWFRAYFKAKMLYFLEWKFQGPGLHHHSITMQSFKNRQTLEQFFEPLYVKTPLPYLQHFTCQQTPLNTCILTQHLRVRSCTEQIPYVQFSLPHVCIIHPHATLIIPHVISKIFHMLVALCYPLCFIPSVYKLQVPILYFLSFGYQI